MKNRFKSVATLHALLAAFVASIVLSGCADMLEPKWYQEYMQGRELIQKDPSAGEPHWKQAVSDLDSDPNVFKYTTKNPINLFYEYGNWLYHQSRYQDAYDLLNKAVAFEDKYHLTRIHSYFLLRLASCEHLLYEKGDADVPDIALVEKAIAVPPEFGLTPGEFTASCHRLMGQIYGDKRDFGKARLMLNQALREFSMLQPRNEREEVLINCDLVQTYVEQGQYAEANETFVDTYKQHPRFINDLRHQYKSIFWRKAQEDAGLFPKIAHLWRRHNFAELDKCINDDIASKARFASGTWYLDAVYDTFTAPSNLPELQQWVKEYPQSSNAKIALADSLTNYAWKARGSGWSSTVTKDGWKLFAERLDQSAKMLQEAQTNSPRWYSVKQTVDLGQSTPAKEYDPMVAEGQKKFPTYATLVFRKAYWLQPRWHGKEGEAEKYIDAEAGKMPPADRDILYAQITWSLERTLGDVFKETHVSWPRTKAGLLACIKKNPRDYYARYALSTLAMRAGDEQTASSAFKDTPAK